MLHSRGASRSGASRRARLSAAALTSALTAALTVSAAAQVLLAARADARAVRGDGDGPRAIGNGTRNRNIVHLDSPTRNRGHQHTAASTAGGATSVADGFCRGARNCDIRQNIAVVVAAPL
ncbi:hypothetical protein AB0O28_28985 [Microbispora sp. NPDC088329]|uniref:hypothetical protein n=1 Tax=Microbispora sp. NPDC088329 TaxID=3154869 RepID=UPI0034457B1D